MSRNVTRLLDSTSWSATDSERKSNKRALYIHVLLQYLRTSCHHQPSSSRAFHQNTKKKSRQIQNAIVYTTTDVVQWIHCACESASIRYGVYIAMIRRERDIRKRWIYKPKRPIQRDSIWYVCSFKTCWVNVHGRALVWWRDGHRGGRVTKGCVKKEGGEMER